MDTKEFVNAVRFVAPALAAKDTIEKLVCFWFSESGVTAFDDMVALVRDFECPFSGNVRGSLILPWLSTVTASELRFKESTNQVQVQAGRSKITLPLIIDDTPYFEEPDLSEAPQLVLGDVAAAIRAALPCIGNDQSHEETMGILLDFVDDGVHVYATDQVSAAHAFVTAEIDEALVETTHALHPRFVELLQANLAEDAVLLFGDTIIGAYTAPASGLYGRVQPEVVLDDVQRIFEIEDDVRASAVPIPERFGVAMKRAEIMVAATKGAAADLEIKSTKLFVTTDTPNGKTHDVVKLSGGHADTKISVLPASIAPLIERCDRFAVSEDGHMMWLFGAGVTYLISGVG